jgi:hypothetical protein
LTTTDVEGKPGSSGISHVTFRRENIPEVNKKQQSPLFVVDSPIIKFIGLKLPK